MSTPTLVADIHPYILSLKVAAAVASSVRCLQLGLTSKRKLSIPWPIHRFTPVLRIPKHHHLAQATYALLEGGVDVNALNECRNTPLHEACSHSDVTGVELLLRWGADEKATDNSGGKATDCMGCGDPDRMVDLEQRETDNQRIRHMLERAPADRPWLRRGWLVLCRYYPTKVQLSTKSNGDGSSPKVAKADCDSRQGFDEIGHQIVDVDDLVGRVVALDAEDVFRVVGFV